MRFAGVAGLCALACGGRSPDFSESVSVLSTTSIEDHVVVVDQGRAEARLLDVSHDGPPRAPTVVPIVQHPVKVQHRKGHDDQLLVLCAGQPDDGTGVPEKPGLVVLHKDGTSTTYSFDAAFNELVQSEDGSYAFLSFAVGTASQGGALLFNPNEIALIHLDDPKSKPAVRTLKSFGSSPHGAAFSPVMSVSGKERRLATVLFDAELAIIDLDHMDDPKNYPEYSVGLAQAGTTGIRLEQVRFSDTEPKIYVRASGSNDVFVVSLLPVPPGVASKNDFKPSVNWLEAGTDPEDMALYQGDDGKGRLLVVSPGSLQALVIDADTSNVAPVPLPQPANQIQIFQGTKPLDAAVKPRAVLYSAGQRFVTFLDLSGIEDLRGQNVELLGVPSAYSKILPLSDGVVMLIQDSGGLSLLDLQERTVSEISGPQLADAQFDPSVQKLWIAPNDALSGRLGFIDLSLGFLPREVRVDAPIRAVIPVPSQTRPRVALTHDSAVGYATVLDAKTPVDPQNPTKLVGAFAMRGYLFEGVAGGGQ